VQFRQECPTRRFRFEIVARAAAVLDEDDAARPFADLCGEAVDPFDDAGQVVFGLAA
jgi:hypothetical protein